MKILPVSGVSSAALLLAATAHAQSAAPAQTIAPPPASAPNTLITELPPPGFRTMTMQTPQGPVTVQWGQPATLPNAADYKATVEQLDANGDGYVTPQELPEHHALSSEFRLVDKNHDGRITAEELSHWQ
jgi:hypothetical protein